MELQLKEIEEQLQVPVEDLVCLKLAGAPRPDRFSALVPRLNDTEMRQLEVRNVLSWTQNRCIALNTSILCPGLRSYPYLGAFAADYDAM